MFKFIISIILTMVVAFAGAVNAEVYCNTVTIKPFKVTYYKNGEMEKTLMTTQIKVNGKFIGAGNKGTVCLTDLVTIQQGMLGGDILFNRSLTKTELDSNVVEVTLITSRPAN